MKKVLASAMASAFLLVSLSGCMVVNRPDAPVVEPTPTIEPAPEVTPTPSQAAPETPIVPEQFTPGNGMPDNEAAAAKALVLTYLPSYRDAVCNLSVSPDQVRAGADTFNGLIASVNADPVVAGTSTGNEFVSGLQMFSDGLTMIADSGMAVPPEYVSMFADSCTQVTDILAKAPTA